MLARVRIPDTASIGHNAFVGWGNRCEGLSAESSTALEQRYAYEEFASGWGAPNSGWEDDTPVW